MPKPLVLLCILSDQAMPNLLSVHHLLAPAIDGGRKVVLALGVTSEMEQKQKLEHFRAALKLGPLAGKLLEVVGLPLGQGARTPAEYESALQNGLGSHAQEAEVILNITGGTKMITLGAHAYGTRTGAEFRYVQEGTSTRLNRLDGSGEDMDPRCVGVEQFLAVQGARVVGQSKRIERWIRLGDAARDCLASGKYPRPSLGSIGRRGETKDALDKLRESLRGGKRLPEGGRIVLESDAMSKAVGKEWPNAEGCTFDESSVQFESGSRIDKQMGQYLTGGWLEALIFAALSRRASELDIHDVRMSVQIEFNGPRDVVTNDLDVAFMRGTTLCTVECKSGGQEHQGADALADLYKAESLLHPLKALHTQVWYATTARRVMDSNEPPALKKSLKDRADLNKWTIVNPVELKELATTAPDSDEELAWLRKRFSAPK